MHYKDEAAEPPSASSLSSAEAAMLTEQLGMLGEIHKPPAARFPDEALARELDVACQRLCLAYSQSGSNVRHHVRTRLDPTRSWLLLQYGKRCAKLAWRSGNVEVFRCGLVAFAIAGLRHGDVRDSLITIEEMMNACVALKLNSDGELERAALLAAPSVAELLRDVGRKSRPTSR